jgi:hypothetical protein
LLNGIEAFDHRRPLDFQQMLQFGGRLRRLGRAVGNGTSRSWFRIAEAFPIEGAATQTKVRIVVGPPVNELPTTTADTRKHIFSIPDEYVTLTDWLHDSGPYVFGAGPSTWHHSGESLHSQSASASDNTPPTQPRKQQFWP